MVPPGLGSKALAFHVGSIESEAAESSLDVSVHMS